jgi:cell wall-associated NlpC family hydrolase
MRIRYAPILCAVLIAAIPLRASADRMYKVRKGDNLSRIAKRFHVKVKSIMEASGLESDRLMPGVRLTIPTSPAKTKEAAPQTAGSQLSRADGGAVEESPQGTRSQSRFALELKELADSPVVKEIKAVRARGRRKRSRRHQGKLIRIAKKCSTSLTGSAELVPGIDCSGYVQKVFSLLDIMLPRTAREQFGLGKRVGKEDLSVGDLVFFRTYAKFPSHVGIYLGDNRFIHASSTERKVTIDRLDAPYFIKRFVGARRLPLNEPADEI